MESRFTDLRQRDASVEMLRVKMSRRRSQTQKENRQQAVNKRRQLDKLPEMENPTLDVSIAAANMSTIQEKTLKNAKSQAAEERMKQLERWKERKACQKEKDMRERARKGVFKTGLFHPKDTFSAPSVSTRAKEAKLNTTLCQSTIVTRSMRPQQLQKPLKSQDPNTAARKAPAAAERSTRSRVALAKPAPPPAAAAVTSNKVCTAAPVGRAASTRSATRPAPPAAAAAAARNTTKDKAADVRTTRSRAAVNAVAPPTGRGRNCKVNIQVVNPLVTKEPSEKQQQQEAAAAGEPAPGPPPSCEDEDMEVDPAAASVPNEDPASFAPDGFVFKAPAGLFKLEPLTPRSADAFLTPSINFSFKVPEVPVFNYESQEEQRDAPPPPKSPRCSPPPTPPPPSSSSSSSSADAAASDLETKHDVPYFRSEICNETNRLVCLSDQWETKVEDESIPEDMRDQMRTTIGQARLLMKERFKQFSGLVDDCELGRGEKETTCTDLQGFWDMVYYQVEDVLKKFDALKAAEARGWIEEKKPAVRQRKVAKKPAAAAAAPVRSTGTKAAARSRLAAVKAAMKAQQQAAAAEKAAEDQVLNSQKTPARPEDPKSNSVVFDGGFFRVESPAKTPVSVRRSSRLVAAPPVSSCSNGLSPLRLPGRPLTPAHTSSSSSSSPAQLLRTTAAVRLDFTQTPGRTPQSRKDMVVSPVREAPADVVAPPADVEAPPADVEAPPADVEAPPADVAADVEAPPADVEAPPADVEAPPADVEAPLSSQDEAAAPPASEALTPVHPLPCVSIVLDVDEPADAAPLPLRLSLSPCQSPPPRPDSCSALTSSLRPPLSSPTVVSCPGAEDSTCNTPDRSVSQENAAFDFDFERYLRPSLRCSLSPMATATPSPTATAAEPLPLTAADVEMDSPRCQYEDQLPQEETAAPAASPLFTPHSPQVQTAESDLFLFTPDLNDRIRQSVCPSDLMVFTPPQNL